MTETKQKTTKIGRYTQAQNKASQKYQREKMTQFNLRFGNEIDADILEKLASVPNKRQYIINLIREDIAREKAQQEEKPMKGYWYAVQKDTEDDWGTGSYDWAEAMEMLRKLREDYPDALIAVIEESDNSVCVEEIRELD